MNRSFVMRGSSLLGITDLLLAGLAGCGKHEAAPVVRPPAFEPESIEIKLGERGDSITLMTTAAGGFTFAGKTFESGADVMTENGNRYTLTMVDGDWIESYNTTGTAVPLGSNGSSVTLVKAEDGSYSIGAEVFERGGTVFADNGKTHVLTLEAGAWTAEFQPGSREIARISTLAMTQEEGDGCILGDQICDEILNTVYYIAIEEGSGWER